MAKRLAVVLALLGLSAPALAADRAPAKAQPKAAPAALSDQQLDQIAAGWAVNVNVSPVVVTQTALALNQQFAFLNNGRVTQNAAAAAVNLASIDYRVTQR